MRHARYWRRKKRAHLCLFLSLQHAFIEGVKRLARGERLGLLTLVKAPTSGGLTKLRIPVAIRALRNRCDAIWRCILLDPISREEIAPVTHDKVPL